MSDSTTPEGLKIAYDQLCKSHDVIDTFRAHLLALLPIASAGGIFLLLNKDILSENATPKAVGTASAHTISQDLLGPIGLFGFVITIGLFAYELYGIRKCHAIILAAKEAEAELGVTGPFTTRPRELLGFINEPFATGIIYPAVMAAWVFLGCYFTLPKNAGWVAGSVFLSGFASTFGYNFFLKADARNRGGLIDVNRRMLEAEEAGNDAALKPLLHEKFSILRSNGKTYDREAYLKDVSANKTRGRSADQVKLRLFKNCAIFACRVTTTREAENKPTVGHFWNTRRFVRQGDEWQCTEWMVMKMCDE